MEGFAVSKVHPLERTPPPSDESLLRAFQYTTKRSLTPKVQTMDLVLIFEGSDKKMVLPTNNISSMELIWPGTVGYSSKSHRPDLSWQGKSYCLFYYSLNKRNSLYSILTHNVASVCFCFVIAYYTATAPTYMFFQCWYTRHCLQQNQNKSSPWIS